jgi:hypothetical protein
MLRVLFEGVTLGAVTQDVQSPAAGYIAFVAVLVFLVGVWLLPARLRSPAGPDDQRLLEDPRPVI